VSTAGSGSYRTTTRAVASSASARRLRPGQDRQHPRTAARRVALDPGDDRVGVRAADEGHVGHPRRREVVEVAAAPGEEAGVVRALEAGSAVTGGHDVRNLRKRTAP